MPGLHRWIKQTAGSWAAASFSTGLLPANNEKVYFGSYGVGSVIAGLDQSAVDLDLLQIDPDYPGDIGTSGDPLRIGADEVIVRGYGQLHITPSVVDFMLVDSENLVNAVALYSGMPTRLRIMKGRVGVLNNVTKASLLEMTYRNYPSTDAALDIGPIQTSSGVCGTLLMEAGLITGPCPVYNGTTSDWFQTGGRVVITSGPMSQITAHIAGGAVDWEPTNPDDLTWSTLHLRSGVVDALGGLPDKTLIHLYEWPKGELLYNASSLAITNPYRMEP